MPGFIINNSGGDQGGGVPSLMEVKRTHRWVFETLGQLTDRTVMLVLKSASRPSFQFEEPSMHHNQEQIYFAGKHTWEPISLSWYDVEQSPDVSESVYQWLGTVIDIPNMNVARPQQYKNKEARLAMLDGAGNTGEEWVLYNGWPQSSNWNSLDYSSSDLQLIEVKYRYDRAVKVQGFGKV